jgi:hypothetical protein
VDQLVFTMQREMNKLQLNYVICFQLLCKNKNPVKMGGLLAVLSGLPLVF